MQIREGGKLEREGRKEGRKKHELVMNRYEQRGKNKTLEVKLIHGGIMK